MATCLFWAAVLSISFPDILRAFSVPGAFGFYAGLNVIALGMIFLFVPETKRACPFPTPRPASASPLTTECRAHPRRTRLHLRRPGVEVHPVPDAQGGAVVVQQVGALAARRPARAAVRDGPDDRRGRRRPGDAEGDSGVECRRGAGRERDEGGETWGERYERCVRGKRARSRWSEVHHDDLKYNGLRPPYARSSSAMHRSLQTADRNQNVSLQARPCWPKSTLSDPSPHTTN